jgi:hypothetical protein
MFRDHASGRDNSKICRVADRIPDLSAHPTIGLDETVHQRHRLGILTITAEAQRRSPPR